MFFFMKQILSPSLDQLNDDQKLYSHFMQANAIAHNAKKIL
jgi:hypothetical protein